MRRGIGREAARPARSQDTDRGSRPRRCIARWAGPRRRSRRVLSHWPRRSARRAPGGWNSDYALRDRTDEAPMWSPAWLNPPETFPNYEVVEADVSILVLQPVRFGAARRECVEGPPGPAPRPPVPAFSPKNGGAYPGRESQRLAPRG